MKKLKRILRKRKIKISHFCKDVLGLKYGAFKYKCVEESFTIEELRIMARFLEVPYGHLIDVRKIEKVRRRSKVRAEVE